MHFYGWSGHPNYDPDLHDRMTIDAVRDSVYRYLLTAPYFDDLDTLKFYSVRLRSHQVFYRSFRNPKVMVGVDDVLYPRDASAIRPLCTPAALIT